MQLGNCMGTYPCSSLPQWNMFWKTCCWSTTHPGVGDAGLSVSWHNGWSKPEGDAMTLSDVDQMGREALKLLVHEVGAIS